VPGGDGATLAVTVAADGVVSDVTHAALVMPMTVMATVDRNDGRMWSLP